MVRNRIPRVCFYFCSTEWNSEPFSLPRKGSDWNSEIMLLFLFHGTEFRAVFSSAEGLGSEFRRFLFRGTAGIPSEISICSVYSVFRGIIFLSEIPNPTNWTSVMHCGDRSLFAIWTCSFPVNNLFPFPLATTKLIGDVWMNRWSRVKMFLSVITAPLVLAQLIDFFIRQCYVNWIVILQIRSTTPIQDMNMSTPIYKKVKNWLRFAYSSWQCLFKKL